MKIQYIILSFLMSTNFACKKVEIIDVIDPEVVNPTFPDKVDMSKIKNLLPEQLSKSGTTIIYKNQDGKEVRLNWKYNDNNHQSTIAGHSYTSSNITGNLTNDERTIGIQIDFMGLLDLKGKEVFRGNVCYNWYLYPQMSVTDGLNLYYDNKLATLSYADFPGTDVKTVQRSTMTLLNKEFKKVFTFEKFNHPHFKDFSFNLEVGLVAFREKSGDLYVYDRHEL